MEQMSSHPAARVIVQKAKEKFGNSLLPIPRNFHEIAGAGVEGDINGEHIIVGSQSLFENNDNKKYHRQQATETATTATATTATTAATTATAATAATTAIRI